MVKKIMIVDDETGVAYTVKTGLEGIDPDYNVNHVDSGKKCLEYLENNEAPDLILLDVMMPGMTGWETYKRIKEKNEWSNIPIVFLTARNDRVAVNAGKFLAEDYIEKPFNVKDLKERIEKILK